MTKPMVREHNIETDEIIDREMTDAEFEFFTKAKAEGEAKAAAEAAKAHERSALLAKLGITEEEAALLLGGN
jgi:hypothetical protein